MITDIDWASEMPNALIQGAAQLVAFFALYAAVRYWYQRKSAGPWRAGFGVFMAILLVSIWVGRAVAGLLVPG